MVRFVFALLLLGAANCSFAQDTPRTEGGKPNLQGIWQAEGRAYVSLENEVARADLLPTLGVVEGGAIPYQPAALLQRLNNFDNRAELDPLNKCYLPGVPRIMTLPHPFNIWQTAEHIAMTFEWTQVFRLIYTAGQEQMYPGFPSWMGDSRGRWEGDTFVVEVSDVNGNTWFDAAGNFGSAALHLTERYRMLDADTIEYQVTFEDETLYTRPWSIRLNLKRQTHLDRILEYQCQAEAEEANGDFEPHEYTWYGSQPPENLRPFDEAVHTEPPLPAADTSIAQTSDGQPNISGYHETDNGGTNYGFTPATGRMHPDSRGVIIEPAGGPVPYQEWARLEQINREEPYRGYDDNTVHCIVAGLPRSMYVPAPYFILQPPGAVVFLHERMSYRVIYLDDISLPEDVRLWQGHSVGQWRNGTLYVQSSNFNGKGWLNEIGDVITHAEQLEETFTPVSDLRVIYRATITDPLAFTRPWTIELPLNAVDQQMLEVACLEDNNDLEHLRIIRDDWRAQQSSGD